MHNEIVAKLKSYLAAIDSERIKSNKVVKTINLFNYIINVISWINLDERLKLRRTIYKKIQLLKSDQYNYLNDNLKLYFYTTLNKCENLLNLTNIKT